MEPESKEENWEIEFDKKFYFDEGLEALCEDSIEYGLQRIVKPKDIKSFIRSEKKKSYELGVSKTDDAYMSFACGMNKLLFQCEKETLDKRNKEISEKLESMKIKDSGAWQKSDFEGSDLGRQHKELYNSILEEIKKDLIDFIT